MRSWLVDLVRFMETSHPEIGKEIAEKKIITPENEALLRQALESFNRAWQ
jgi:F-type H+-transporting ATPase subunit alpha